MNIPIVLKNLKLFLELRAKPIARRLVQIMLCLLLMLLPTALVRFLANAAGHSIASSAKIGFSWVDSDRLVMARGSRIGHFNLARLKRIVLRENGSLGNMNICRGPCSLYVGEGAAIGNRNTMARGRKGVTVGPAVLWLSKGSKITAGHSLDCTQSIRFGAYSTLAGKMSQIWTHGYVHYNDGPKRYRIDGRVVIGINCSIGSRSIITGGIRICDNACVGAGSCVTKTLKKSGFYVPGGLRLMPKPSTPEKRKDMEHVSSEALIETVFKKRISVPEKNEKER